MSETVHAAYISYVCDQNAPSRPKPTELTMGQLKDQLETLFDVCFEPDEDPDRYDEEDGPKVILIEVENYYGDVRVYDKRDDDSVVFVTFPAAKRSEMFEELGLDLNELQR
jgi:hypothetical protein